MVVMSQCDVSSVLDLLCVDIEIFFCYLVNIWIIMIMVIEKRFVNAR